MKSRERVFTHPSQLNALSALPFLRTTGWGSLRLGGNIAKHSQRKQWESELNRYYYACGCNASAMGLLIALLLSGAWAGYSYFNKTSGGAAIGIVFLFTIAGAIVGKIIGRFQANVKLKRTVGEIQQQWKPDDKSEVDDWTCG